MNTDICKFELSQKDESRAQWVDSSKAYRKSRAFNWVKYNNEEFQKCRFPLCSTRGTNWWRVGYRAIGYTVVGSISEGAADLMEV